MHQRLVVYFQICGVFLIVAVIIFSIISVLGGHYIHRKRQFRIEQELATEENPYLYRAMPGKERDLMVPICNIAIGNSRRPITTE